MDSFVLQRTPIYDAYLECINHEDKVICFPAIICYDIKEESSICNAQNPKSNG